MSNLEMSHQVSLEDVRRVLREFPDPETGRNLLETEQARNIELRGQQLSLELALTSHAAPLAQETRADLIERLRNQLPGLTGVEVTLGAYQRPAEPLGQVGLRAKSVIAVGSGKGGVGKSTVAAILAFGLARSGCRVGLMDADVYGPSVPHLVGVNQRPELVDQKIQPIEAAGVKVMSMGFFVPPGEAVVWRGPMLHGAIQQFLRDTAWGELDYLIIDMPPGTGDIALTLSQLLPLTGAVVVCTPQDVALLDATKAIAMFRKVNIPLLGMVENMSGFVAPETGQRYDIFGHGGARKRADELQVPVLGEVPIQIPIRVAGDEGRIASVLDDPQIGPALLAMVKQLVRNIAATRREAPALPSLTVI